MRIKKLDEEKLNRVRIAESKVRRLEQKLFEAELELLEAKDDVLTEDSVSTGHYGIRVTLDNGDVCWATRLENGTRKVQSVPKEEKIAEFATEDAARNSEEYDYLQRYAARRHFTFEIVQAAN